jgi:hypothetical protein
MPGLSHEMNPIWILLEKVKEVPRIVQLIDYATGYCVRMAKAEKDPNFVSPIADIFLNIVSQKGLDPDIVSGILGGLAYIPAMGGAFPAGLKYQLLSRREIPFAVQCRSLPFIKRCHGNLIDDAAIGQSIGLKFWLVWFTYYCIVYILVLTAEIHRS